MNELIENKLMGHLEKIMLSNRKLEALALFQSAIQTACQAQRNACARVYVDANFDFNDCDYILNAQIERQDYE